MQKALTIGLDRLKMVRKRNNTSSWSNKHIRYVVLTLLICSIIYYVPTISGALGWTEAEQILDNSHNIYGIDFLGLIFFAPVVYAAYVLGIIPALVSALVAFLVLLPYAIFIDTYPDIMFKPAAFVIILGAVGAVVAMLQKSEQYHRQRIREMRVIYDIGKAVGESGSAEGLLSKIVNLIPQAMLNPKETGVRITFRDHVFKSDDFQKSGGKITENLVIGGENVGMVEICSSYDNPYLRKKNLLTKTLAETISGAIRQVELERSLQKYYAQLENEVEIRWGMNCATH